MSQGPPQSPPKKFDLSTGTSPGTSIPTGVKGVSHYENFPVASWLCPPRLRPPIAAIYHFARTADDIADEGNAPAAQRLADLEAFRADLHAIAQGQPHSGRWPVVFEALAPQLRAFALPVPLLNDLLSAFTQDVVYNKSGRWYENDTELLDYCARSANPVGRLLLHLYGITNARSLAQSDAICSALQLINFWQDLSRDIPLGRYYLPLDSLAAHNVLQQDLLALRQTPNAIKLIASRAHSAWVLMQNGFNLPLQVPGRAGWELRLVVQGGLRILERIEQQGYTTLSTRPSLGKWDVVVMLWRALRMGAKPSRADGTIPS
jgi:squalene synthase HpnC